MRHKSISNNMLPTEYLVSTKFSLEKRENFFSIDNLMCGMSVWPNIEAFEACLDSIFFAGKPKR